MVRYKVVINGSEMIVTDLTNTRVWIGPKPPMATEAPTLKQLVLEGRAKLTILAKQNEIVYCPFCGAQVSIAAQSAQYTCPVCNRVLNVEIET